MVEDSLCLNELAVPKIIFPLDLMQVDIHKLSMADMMCRTYVLTER